MNTKQEQIKDVEYYKEQYEMQEASARIRKANLEKLHEAVINFAEYEKQLYNLY